MAFVFRCLLPQIYENMLESAEVSPSSGNHAFAWVTGFGRKDAAPLAAGRPYDTSRKDRVEKKEKPSF